MLSSNDLIVKVLNSQSGVPHSWNPYVFNFVEYIFRKGWNFLTKFGSNDSSFSRGTVTLLYLKYKISSHAQIPVIHYYILFTSFLTWYEFEIYIGDTFWQMKMVNEFINVITWLFLKMYSGLWILRCPCVEFVMSKSQLYDLLKCWHFH